MPKNGYYYDHYLVTPKGQLKYFHRDYPISDIEIKGAGALPYDERYEWLIKKGRGIKSDAPTTLQKSTDS